MIETLQDWNTRLDYCGCCPMPMCPAPVVLCEAKYATVDREDTWESITYDASGDLFAGDPIEYTAFHPSFTDAGGIGVEVPTIYRKATRTYEELLGQDPHDDIIKCSSATVKTFTRYLGYGVGLSTYQTLTLSEPITKAELETLTQLKMEADAWGNTTGTGPYVCRANKAITWVTYPVNWVACDIIFPSLTLFGAISGLRKIRFRFRIPSDHAGSKFTITYDVGEFPEDGDPSFLSQDNVVEWTGRGSGLSTDPSWLTPWVEIEPPTTSGERRIVNIRYTCYTGTKYGVKPQVMGEALELPPP